MLPLLALAAGAVGKLAADPMEMAVTAASAVAADLVGQMVLACLFVR